MEELVVASHASCLETVFFFLSLFSFFFLFLVIECECVSIGVHEVDALTLFIYFPVLKRSIIPDSIHALRVLGCALMHASKKKKKQSLSWLSIEKVKK